MKRKLFTFLLTGAFIVSFCVPASAAPEDSGAAMAVDAIIARPLCLAATAIGSALFVVCLPVSIPTKSVNRSAQAFVVTPARATFTRPLGDFEGMKE